MKNTQNTHYAYINGQWCEAQDASMFQVQDPATEAVIASVTDCGPFESEQAIKAAEGALPGWSRITAHERSAILRRWREAILADEERLAEILSTEQGKPLSEAKSEVRYGAAFVEWFAEEAKRIYGDIIPSPYASQRISVKKQPVGVVAAITPWNFPNAMIMRKAAPALAAGCTMILKPAPETPLSAIALAGLAKEAGVPDGVLNILPTTRAEDVVRPLMQSAVVRKVSFTGSTRVGKILAQQSASTLKKMSLELGGNAPFIVFDDADIDLAIKGLMAGKFRNAGQACVAVNRIFVQSGVHDQFVQKLMVCIQDLKVGGWTDANTTTGPLISQSAQRSVSKLLASALEDGAYLAHQTPCVTDRGFFVAPALLTGVTSEMAIATEEVFGPIASIIRFTNEKDVIHAANNTLYGLAAYFYSQDINRITRVSEALEYGMVGINETVISNEVAPFGGIKESGMGREGSKYGLEEYLELKYLCLGNQ